MRSFISLFIALALVACSEAPVPMEGADENGFTAPTAATLAANKAVAERIAAYPSEDFEQARRGLIASADSLVIRDPDGKEVWNQDAYRFIEGDAPGTVNPSLWRQEQLNNIHGLFEVVPGIYQLRGYDLANMTLIEGESGWIVVDPLTTEPTARAGMAFVREHLDDRPVRAIIFTHSHIDHFGGVAGALRESDYEGLRVIAPVGFLEEAVSENLLAGPAMQRRATFMYGRNLPVTPRGHVGTGLGKEPAKGGLIDILEPTDIIEATGQRLTIDGVEMVFQNVGGSEAPAELTFYMPQHKAFCGAEMVSRNMHNLYTLRGAKVRDALLWSGFIDEALTLFGSDAEVYFGSHHWPIWGQSAIQNFLAGQRDTYKYLHDQTLRMANNGATPREISEAMTLPEGLASNFANRGYYGTPKHNSKAVYQFYFGWYDGNPANLDPHPPEAAATRYVDYMGGAESVLEKAQASFDEGDYRWVAEVLNHLVFAEPGNQRAIALLAAAYDQLAYQAESGPWRDVYLTASWELRRGKPDTGTSLSDAAGLIKRVPTPLFFQTMAASIDGERAADASYVINMTFTDTGEVIVLTLSNGVLRYREGEKALDANAGITLTRELFLSILLGNAGLRDTLLGDDLSVEGSRLDLLGFFRLFQPLEPVFEVVRP
ncbi:alkyl/aryl-sulfatase [Halioglobus pacificus]|uniref:Beta-lactamase-like protein n=1 Tax=Parahalioglobus pacificus TaxID=930806 RepID=A0A918XEQ9_9GAMM|nr:alkyl sulfatase dimerization domain-containing protein [Halioglobus pacificus]GHD28913.1 beta-lactamase-like protein [Halioglobus pacificus]